MTEGRLPVYIDPGEAQRFHWFMSRISDYAIYMLDINGYVSSWNAGAQRFKGYAREEIMGRHFSTFYTEEDRQAGLPQQALRSALDTGKFEAEGWRVRKDGSRFWASIVIDPLRDDDGIAVGFAKITRDITEQHAAREALRQSETRFRLLVEGVTDYAIYMLSPEGKVSNWNTGAQRIKGYSSEEAIGTHFSRFYTEEARAAGLPQQSLDTASREGRAEHEGWRVRKDGSRFWAHVVIDAIRDDSGTLLGYAKITRDITERKQAEEALERANAALMQSQKLEAIGKLTGGVAHDFNNLLAIVSSSLDVLALRLRDPADLRLLDGMQRAVDRGAKLTQQLLAFARQQPLKVEPHDVNALIEGFETVLRRAGNRSIAFDIDLEPLPAVVAIDATRFESALLNLVVNARDAMPEGGKLALITRSFHLEAACSAPAGPAPGAYVRVSVRDTGCGMPPDVAQRIFEPFFTTKPVGKGTGLGLSQVHGFITQCGGFLEVDTAPGQGTTIHILLPIVSGAPVANLPGTGRAAVERVLIVDDERDVREAAAELFHSIGYEVLSTARGETALDILHRRADIDLLFTDVMLHDGMNGIELAREVRARYPHVHVVLASGYALPALRSSHGDLDDFPFVSKPYRLSELARKLRTLA